MSAAYEVRHFGTGYGWHVQSTELSRDGRSVAGPYTTREAAQAKADELNAADAGRQERLAVIAEAAATGEPAPLAAVVELASILESQAELNVSTAKAFGAFSLMHDRYDAELTEIRKRLSTLESDIAIVAERLDRINRLHSVKA